MMSDSCTLSGTVLSIRSMSELHKYPGSESLESAIRPIMLPPSEVKTRKSERVVSLGLKASVFWVLLRRNCAALCSCKPKRSVNFRTAQDSRRIIQLGNAQHQSPACSRYFSSVALCQRTLSVRQAPRPWSWPPYRSFETGTISGKSSPTCTPPEVAARHQGDHLAMIEALLRKPGDMCVEILHWLWNTRRPCTGGINSPTTER